MTNWPKIRLLEGRLLWHRGKAAYRRRQLIKWKITGDRAHYWLSKHEAEHNAKAIRANNVEILRARGEIAKWTQLLVPEVKECHALETAIRALKPKKRLWAMGGLVKPGEPWKEERWDQGKDIRIRLGHAFAAQGDGVVLEYASDGPFPYGFGSPYVVVRYSNGPFYDEAMRKGQAPEQYFGHCNIPLVSPGERFRVGQPIAIADHELDGGGWGEIGHWPPGSKSEGERWAAAYRAVWR